MCETKHLAIFQPRKLSFEICIQLLARRLKFPTRSRPISEPRARTYVFTRDRKKRGGKGGTRVGQRLHENSKSNLAAGEGWRREARKREEKLNRRTIDAAMKGEYFRKSRAATIYGNAKCTRDSRVARVRFTEGGGSIVLASQG